VVSAGHHSKATLVLRHQGSSQHSGNVEVIVGDGAELTVVSVQDWDDDALHAAQHEALVGRDAVYRHIAVSVGGGVVRMHSNVRYAGVGGSAELLGLYFVDAGQHIEHRLFVDHNNPRGVSNVDYRGALQGEGARSVWIGDVLIRKTADDISTYEANKNLVLTDGCRADSVPNLEIETGEIRGAGHCPPRGASTTTALLPPVAGLSEEAARRLVVRGFFASIISKIGVPDLEAYLLETVDRELEKSERS
jgi:Fe-S cluster assembly protein SufD